MAVKYSEIHAEKTIEKLSPDEKKYLDKLEAYTDEVIKKDYGVNSTEHMYLDESKVEACLKGLPVIRRSVVELAWKELYKGAEWELSSSRHRDEIVWRISPIKK